MVYQEKLCFHLGKALDFWLVVGDILHLNLKYIYNHPKIDLQGNRLEEVVFLGMDFGQEQANNCLNPVRIYLYSSVGLEDKLIGRLMDYNLVMEKHLLMIHIYRQDNQHLSVALI